MIRLGCLVVFLLVVAYCVAAFRLLPWWGAMLAVAGLAIFLVYALPRLAVLAAKGWLRRKVEGLMEAKSGVLAGAEVEVHSVAWIDAPPESDVAGPLLRIEATVRPADRPAAGEVRAAGATPMRFWDPSDFALVPADAPPVREAMREAAARDGDPDLIDAEAEPGAVLDVRVLEAGEERPADKVAGVRRVAWSFAAPPSLGGRAKLRYFLEDFPALDVPPRPATRPGPPPGVPRELPPA